MKSTPYYPPIKKDYLTERQTRLKYQYIIIEHFQNKIAKLSLEELKVFAKMNDIKILTLI